MIICGKNVTRKELNNEKRTLKGLNVAETPRDGERLVVLENNVSNFIFNGMLLEVKEPVNYTGPARSILISPIDTFYYTKDIKRINDPDPIILHESGLCFVDEYDTIPKVNKLFDRIGIENNSKDPYGNYFEATQEPYKVKRTISSICKLKNIPIVDFGYALTLHKCQGSSYDKVLVYFEYMKGMDSDMKKKWMYTAVTRAERALCIVE